MFISHSQVDKVKKMYLDSFDPWIEHITLLEFQLQNAYLLKGLVTGLFAVGLFTVGHFAVGNFTIRTFHREDSSP